MKSSAAVAVTADATNEDGISISSLVEQAKAQSQDVLSLLRNHFSVVEVEV